MGGGRTGVSLEKPLRTPTQSPPKNINKTQNHNKNRKTHKSQKHYTNINKKTVNIKESSFNILSTNACGLKHKAEDLKN